ncbi:hypothetical protein CEXT_542711 [Caerostris extrusa]|uniref:Uncharacterized protein n=1 Tax=Caerostris extrusa TaxID=172846 RepID=A0AAV4PQ19_CAEEX|nr:hypothetical protein CEXT_542711 [Caerostris extrusa]
MEGYKGTQRNTLPPGEVSARDSWRGYLELLRESLSVGQLADIYPSRLFMHLFDVISKGYWNSLNDDHLPDIGIRACNPDAAAVIVISVEGAEAARSDAFGYTSGFCHLLMGLVVP